MSVAKIVLRAKRFWRVEPDGSLSMVTMTSRGPGFTPMSAAGAISTQTWLKRQAQQATA